MKKQRSVYVSRHGRKTTLEGDLETLNIDQQPTADVTSKRRRTMPAVQLRTPTHFSKKRAFVIGSAVIAVFLIPVLALELVAMQYKASANQLATDVKDVGSSVALPNQKTGKARAGIEESLKKLTGSKDRACRGGLLDNAAGLYPRAKQALQRCNESREKVATIVASLSNLQSADDYMSKVNDILKKPLAAHTGAYAVLPDQVAAWQAAQKNLKSIRPPSDLSSFHAALTQNVATITTAWSELNTANNQQDTDAFRDAEGKLTYSYDTFRAAASELHGLLEQSQAELTHSYEAI